MAIFWTNDMIHIYWVMALKNSDHYKAHCRYFKWT